jgi:hypothetical protein
MSTPSTQSPKEALKPNKGVPKAPTSKPSPPLQSHQVVMNTVNIEMNNEVTAPKLSDDDYKRETALHYNMLGSFEFGLPSFLARPVHEQVPPAGWKLDDTAAGSKKTKGCWPSWRF